MTLMNDTTAPIPDLYERPWHVERPEECDFYHVMDLPGIGATGGQWDLRSTVDTYLGNVDFRGKRVLDVGTASGFLTFEMEKRGADVVSFDAGRDVQKDLIPFHVDAAHRAERIADTAGYTSRMKNSYWLAHRLLNSKAKAYYGNLYALPETLGRFDIVVVAQILVHLRDPVQALTQACRLSDDMVIISEGMLDMPTPIGLFFPDPNRPDANQSWWRYSVGFYRRLLRILGFGVTSVTTSSHRCTVPGQPPMTKISTIVARRNALAESAKEELSFRAAIKARFSYMALGMIERFCGEARPIRERRGK